MNKPWVILLSVGLTVGIALVLQDFPFIKNLLPEQPSTEIPLVTPTREKPKTDVLQSGKIDEHLTIDNTLRDIDLCGATYQIETVFIDGVNVLDKVAKLTQQENMYSATTTEAIRTFAKNICGTIKFYQTGNLWLEKVVTYARDLPLEMVSEENKTYGIYTRMFQISVTPFTNTIDTVSFFDGEHIYLTNLK